MKLHDPATERQLMRLAIQARKSRVMEPYDRRKKSEKIGQLVSLCFILYVISALLGAYDARLRTQHWQFLICCVWFLWVAQIGLGLLFAAVTRYQAVLVNLPIPGEFIMRWARHRFLLENCFSLLSFSGLFAFALFHFSLKSPWLLAAATLLLFAMTLSTIILLEDAWVCRLRIVKIWTISSILMFVGMAILYFFNRKIFLIGGTPDWLVDGIMKITWLFPTSWILPGRIEQGGVWIALLWIGLGIMRWMAWPKVAAPYFDAPQDFIEAFGEFAVDDEEEEELEEISDNTAPEEIDHSASAMAVVAQNKTRTKTTILPITEPLAMATGGWVDQWIERIVGKNNSTLAGVITNPIQAYTTRTNRFIAVAPVWLAVIWTITTFYPASASKDFVVLCSWVLSPLLLCFGLLPYSNAVPRAMAAWNLGPQSLPFFSMLPISTRDLLRISMRITVARSLVMALLATPLCWLLMVILAPQDTPWVACWLAPALCCFWATSRPLFVWYRLQSATRYRRGTLVSRMLGVLISIALSIIWLVSGAVGIFSGIGYLIEEPSGNERWLLPSLAVGGLILSGLCARAVFAIHRWQLSRRHFDWLSSE